MEEILNVFVQEAREQLTAMEDGLLQMEQGYRDTDLLSSIFRAAHTIKGASGVVELRSIERFTHILENLLDRVRHGELRVGEQMITVLLRGCDHLRAQLDMVDQGYTDDDPELAEAERNLARELQAFDEATPARHTKPSPDSLASPDAAGYWHISIRFGPDVLRMGMDPLNFLRYLQQLGEITRLTTLSDAMPRLADFDPETCYLGFEISLRSSASKQEIDNVFAFCRDDCELHILPLDIRLADTPEPIENLPEEPMRPREILVQNKAAQPDIVDAATAEQKQPPEKRRAGTRLIRVQADKLDQLIDLVGELVIASASASLLAQKSGRSHLAEANSALSRLVEDIRDSALQLRMVQIGETFNRFNRVVRDTARELGKEIDLIINGAETELDKSVVEKVGDPLMHLMRNAMDHGIEPREARLAAGKPARGRLELNAFHDSGSIIIEVIDDGGGINTQKVQARALERGLIQPGQTLTEQETLSLLFEAGFSTSDTVSNLSGRGVGMDVVKRNIEALRGTVDVETRPGQGSRFTIRLPLTLAIIDGFLTTVGSASYIVPLDSVVECLELEADSTRGHMLNLRGEVLPFIRLRNFFENDGEPPERENVVVITAGSVKAGIVVDQLHGQFQTVIKPLGQLFRHLRGIGGSTILGSGEVALILDVQALIRLAVRREEESFGSAPASPLPATEPLQHLYALE